MVVVASSVDSSSYDGNWPIPTAFPPAASSILGDHIPGGEEAIGGQVSLKRPFCPPQRRPDRPASFSSGVTNLCAACCGDAFAGERHLPHLRCRFSASKSAILCVYVYTHAGGLREPKAGSAASLRDVSSPGELRPAMRQTESFRPTAPAQTSQGQENQAPARRPLLPTSPARHQPRGRREAILSPWGVIEFGISRFWGPTRATERSQCTSEEGKR